MMIMQIFSEMEVHFSIGGEIYHGDAIVMRPAEDRIFENSRNVTVKLHHRVGRFDNWIEFNPRKSWNSEFWVELMNWNWYRFVKVRLAFANRWILISEVSFKSGNFHQIIQ